MFPRLIAVVGTATILVLGCAPARPPAPVGPPDPTWAAAPTVVVDSTPPGAAIGSSPARPSASMRLGPNDLLEITVFEAPEMSRSARVAATGHISLPLLGDIVAAGRTPRELEQLLEDSLRQRYIRDPHVSVEVSEMQSHAVSVVGAVTKPGVFQLRESRPLLELLALAGGLAPDAGETVIVVRDVASRATLARGGASAAVPGSGGAAAPTEAITISLRALLESGDPRHNIDVHPGDLVKVTPAGLVYVVGEVRRPGAFPLARRPTLTVLQAIALGEGLGPNAARGRARIIRTDAAGERIELPVDLGDVIAGRAMDVVLQPQDVVFVPSSRARTVTLGLVDALVRMVTLRGVF